MKNKPITDTDRHGPINARSFWMVKGPLVVKQQTLKLRGFGHQHAKKTIKEAAQLSIAPSTKLIKAPLKSQSA